MNFENFSKLKKDNEELHAKLEKLRAQIAEERRALASIIAKKV